MSIIDHNPTTSRLSPLPARERIARGAQASSPPSVAYSSSRASPGSDNAIAERRAQRLLSRVEVLWEIGSGAITSLPEGIACEQVCAAHARWAIVRSGGALDVAAGARHAYLARCELVLRMKDGTAHTRVLHEGVLCVAHTSIDAHPLVSLESVERGLLSVVIEVERRQNAESDPVLSPLYARTSVLQGALGLKGGVYDQPTITLLCDPPV